MKKFLKILGTIFLVLFGCFCALVLVCAVRPEVTRALADFLYPDRSSAVSAEAGGLSPRGEEEAGGEFDGRNQMSGVFSLDDTGTGDFALNGIGEDNGEQGSSGAGGGLPGSTSGADIPRAEGIAESVNPEYVPPEISEIQVPGQVSGKNGYQQIQDEGGQIEDEEAGQLQSQLGPGSVGDGLVFDRACYPYYEMLDEAGKHLYRQIYANANDLIMAFAPIEEVTASKLRTVFSAVYNDHPELFWLETAYYGKYRRDGICVEIDLRMNYTAQNLESSKAMFNEKANEILAGAVSLSNSYEKEKYVHDALIDRITYNMGAEMNQSAYSALVNGQTVCAGYARAFQYLMQQLGIPCYYCTGYAGENHAWNIISLEDGYYNVDVTWDDTEGGNYDYFNKTDQDYAGTHVRQELSVYLPPCNGQRYRNLEQDGNGEENLRGIEELGISEEEILTSVSDYYDDCGRQVRANGLGSFTFFSVVDGKTLAEELYRSYRQDTYRQGYMEEAMAEVGAVTCTMGLEFEPLKGGRYLVTHTVNLK